MFIGMTVALLQLFSAVAGAETSSGKGVPAPESFTVTTDHKGTFGSKAMAYRAVVSSMALKKENGDIYADVVTTAYLAKKTSSTRPVTFVFNGGPGSSSVWLHMGLLGPKLVQVPSDAKDAGLAPYRLVDNPDTVLDLTDLVFIDPVGTGYSRLAGVGKPEDVYGLAEDARSVAQIVREWIRRNNRWNTPIYIVGESFGTTRAAAMIPYLERGDEPVRINGLVLISQALDYTGSTPAADNLVAFVTYLPTMAATAVYHGKVMIGNRSLEDYLAEVRAFAVDSYLPALFKGTSLPPADFDRIAARLSVYLGISEAYIKRARLRVLAGRFVKELLRSEGLSVGRLDGRYKTNEVDDTDVSPRYDAGSAAISGAYSAAFHQYARTDLKVTLDRPYYISGPEVEREWVWARPDGGYSEPNYVNTAPDLANGMRHNPHMRVFLASGYYDYATPFFDGEYTFWRHGIDMRRVTARYYPAGHMMYVHQPSLKALASDLRLWFQSGGQGW